jgi:hypothetical protein
VASSKEEVFYQDEADVHLNPKIGATYLKRGQQPVVLTPGNNVKRYIFGALNARTAPGIFPSRSNSFPSRTSTKTQSSRPCNRSAS